MAWLGVAVARSGVLPRWSGWLLVAAGLFMGVSGFLIWQLRPIGALCLLVGGLGIAWLGTRQSPDTRFNPATTTATSTGSGST
jgi:hypothetical protein